MMTSNKIITNRKKILEAVKQEGGALEYASDSLKADHEVVLEAVKQDGNALELSLIHI